MVIFEIAELAELIVTRQVLTLLIVKIRFAKMC